MARRIDKCDLLALDIDDIRTDPLRNAAGLTCRHIGLTDCIEDRSLAVVDVSHNADNRRTRNHIRFVLFFFLEHLFDCIDLDLMFAENIVVNGDLFRLIVGNLRIERVHLAGKEKLLDQLVGRHFHLLCQFADGELIRQRNRGDLLLLHRRFLRCRFFMLLMIVFIISDLSLLIPVIVILLVAAVVTCFAVLVETAAAVASAVLGRCGYFLINRLVEIETAAIAASAAVLTITAAIASLSVTALSAASAAVLSVAAAIASLSVAAAVSSLAVTSLSIASAAVLSVTAAIASLSVTAAVSALSVMSWAITGVLFSGAAGFLFFRRYRRALCFLFSDRLFLFFLCSRCCLLCLLGLLLRRCRLSSLCSALRMLRFLLRCRLLLCRFLLRLRLLCCRLAVRCLRCRCRFFLRRFLGRFLLLHILQHLFFLAADKGAVIAIAVESAGMSYRFLLRRLLCRLPGIILLLVRLLVKILLYLRCGAAGKHTGLTFHINSLPFEGNNNIIDRFLKFLRKVTYFDFCHKLPP